MTDVDSVGNVDAMSDIGLDDLAGLFHAARWGFDFEGIAHRLQNDPQFALEMRVCKEWRIPHSEFLGWAVEDQEKALGHFAFEAQRCGNCGIHPLDWPDPTEPLFVAEAKVCPGCAELDRYQRWVQEQAETAPKSAMDGMKTYLKAVGD